MDVADKTKAALRARMKRLRSNLDAQTRAESDGRIEERVLSLGAYVEAEVILSYVDVGTEVRTRGIIEAALRDGKTVALPWCVPGTLRMRWYRVTSLDSLVRGPLGVLEPVPDERCEQPVDAGQRMVALVPGLAFDTSGYRLGYGGGYYDVFLCSFAGTSVGLCRRAQLVDDLGAWNALEPHDLPVDILITD